MWTDEERAEYAALKLERDKLRAGLGELYDGLDEVLREHHQKRYIAEDIEDDRHYADPVLNGIRLLERWAKLFDYDEMPEFKRLKDEPGDWECELCHHMNLYPGDDPECEHGGLNSCCVCGTEVVLFPRNENP
jgi:hypothetical protein